MLEQVGGLRVDLERVLVEQVDIEPLSGHHTCVYQPTTIARRRFSLLATRRRQKTHASVRSRALWKGRDGTVQT